jgi:hypothetical protein
MTGLGEFSPIGQLLNMGSFLKITEESLIWDYFFRGKSSAFILTKGGLCYKLGDFFHELIWSPCFQTISDQGD